MRSKLGQWPRRSRLWTRSTRGQSQMVQPLERTTDTFISSTSAITASSMRAAYPTGSTSSDSPLRGSSPHFTTSERLRGGQKRESDRPKLVGQSKRDNHRYRSVKETEIETIFSIHHARILSPFLSPQAWFDKDLSSCVLGGDAECQFNPDFAVSVEQQLTYFCGSAPQCLRVGERTALAVAKANLERHYATVGLAEDLPTSFRVMEQLLPRFFAGASRIFARMERSDGQQYRRNEGDHKDYYVSNEALAVLRANMSLELEFYEFSRQRLVQQLTNLGL